MKNKSLQFFSDEYLESCRKLSPEQILIFLENFRQLHRPSKHHKSKLISIKVPEVLLNAFKAKAALEKVPYQTLIKILMKKALES